MTILDRIAARLDGHEWNADTCNDIAAILREHGYQIADVDDQGERQITEEEADADEPRDSQENVR